MKMPFDLRTVFVVTLILAFAQWGLGRPLPLNSTNTVMLISSIALFGSYLYSVRTLSRFPFAVVITIRRTLHARKAYKLQGIESLRDGYTRGFLDSRRWTVQPLVLVDRVVVCSAVLLSTTPGFGQLFVSLGGLIGFAMLVAVYLLRGSFSWLVADQLESPVTATQFPFINRRD